MQKLHELAVPAEESGAQAAAEAERDDLRGALEITRADRDKWFRVAQDRRRALQAADRHLLQCHDWIAEETKKLHRITASREFVADVRLGLRNAPEEEARSEQGGWRPIETAPKDGTRILTWCVHRNAKLSSDPIGERWAAAVIAEWTDFNGGGWVWHGLCGEHVAWQPLPPPKAEGDHGE